MMKELRMRWFLRRVLWRMTWKARLMKLTRVREFLWNFVEWRIKARFGCSTVWRSTRLLRIVPRVADNKPVWALVQDEKTFFGWKRVDIATGVTAEELLPLADHRMQPARFLTRDKDGKYALASEERAHETYAMKVIVHMLNDAKKWEVMSSWSKADASDELRPEGAAAGAATTGGDGEVHSQPVEEARDRETQGGETTKDTPHPDREDRPSEEVTGEVSGERSEVLGRRE